MAKEAEATQLPGTPLRSPRTAKAPAQVRSPSPAVDVCLAVSGLPDDATQRELHVLFSGCPGYAGSSLVLEESKPPVALILFDTSDNALAASRSRRNTSWVAGQKVDFEVRRPEHLEDVLRQRGRKPGPKQPAPSPKPREASAGRSKTPKVAAKPSCHPCTVEANFARARVEEALKKNNFPELASSLAEATIAGVAEAELLEARQKLEVHQHRLAVRSAVFAQQRARNRLADSWELLETATDPAKRIACAEQAIREGEEACKLCAKAAQKVEESRLREAVEVLCKKWMRLVQAKIREARYDPVALRAALAEAESLVAAVNQSMLRDGPSSGPPTVDVEEVLSEVAEAGDERSPNAAGGYPDAALSAAASLRRGGGASFFDPAFLEVLQEARHNVVDEENKAAVRLKLEAALDETSPQFVRSGPALSALLGEAKNASVDGPVIKRGEIRLAVLEGQAAARWMLFTSFVRLQKGTLGSCISGPDDMKYTLKLAKNMGLGKAQLQPSLEFYDKLEKLRVVVRALADALRECDLGRMREVLRRILASGVAEESQLITLYIDRLQKRLARAEQQAQVGEKLKQTMAKSSRHTQLLEDLPERIEEAQRAGMRNAAVDDAKQQLRRSAAHKRLEAAMDLQGGLSELQDAYEEAVAAGVDEGLLREACDLKEAEELQQSILLAADTFQLADLEQHLRSWRDRSYDSPAVDDVMGKLPQMRELVQRCQDSIDGLRPIQFSTEDANSSKLDKPMLDVISQASTILKKTPRLPVVIEVFATAKKAVDAQERSLLQANVLKEELSKRCSNALRACGQGHHPSGNKVNAVKLRVDTGTDPPVPKSPSKPPKSPRKSPGA